ncbi:MAG: hypothetical protein BA865_07180 [Desulfobacterales bacterium S5133MH4]|nr:MAG: hypothetical protein BA865_07180 [Desulfobacterales bacterium S5133MH4]
MNKRYQKLKNFVKTSLLGGLGVIFPAALLLVVFSWVFQWVGGIIEPLTRIIVAKSNMQEILANILVIGAIIAACFFIGIFVKTRLGRYIHILVEKLLGRWIPGYKFSTNTFQQFFGERSTTYSAVALVKPFGNETLMTGFITDEHPDGSCSIFVPTGPNPTSGNIFHLPSSCVYRVDIPVEEAMKSVIACGAGSEALMQSRHELNEIKPKGAK